MTTSPTLSPLEHLPLHVFEEICEHLTIQLGKAGRRTLSALASTSRCLLSATARLQFQVVQVRFENKPQLRQEVEKWSGILETRGCAQHVRRLSIVEYHILEAWEENEEQIQWPPDREDNPYAPVDDDVWALDKDDEFWTRPVPIEFRPWGPVPTPDEKAEELGAWAPVAEFINSLPDLRDVDYQGKDQIPTTILRALNEREGGPVRLHMYGFSLRSLYQDASQPRDIDEDEWYLVTSPCLSSIRLLIPYHRDKPYGLDEYGRVDFNEEAVGRMLEGLAPNLKSVSVASTYTMKQTQEAFTWAGFFPRRSPDTDYTKCKGKLEAIAMELGVHADADVIRAWESRTDFNVLRSLHLRTFTMDVPTLNALSKIAETGSLTSLRNLSLWTDGVQDNDYEGDHDDHGDPELARLLRGLQPLRSLEIKGPFADETFGAIIRSHGSLRRLRLVPERDHNVQPIPFIFTRHRVEELVKTCSNIQDLEILIPRSKGDEEEAGIYRALAKFPVLDRLSLLLDCSHFPETEEPGNRSGVPDKCIRDGIVNLNTSDRALAVDIFDAICTRRSPRLIRMYPEETGNFGTEIREWSMIFIRDALARGWIRQRDDRWGHEGESRIVEVEAKNRKASDGEFLMGEFYDAFRAVWPDSGQWPGGDGDYRSFPLWKSS